MSLLLGRQALKVVASIAESGLTTPPSLSSSPPPTRDEKKHKALSALPALPALPVLPALMARLVSCLAFSLPGFLGYGIQPKTKPT
jgi:hypothetical protein